MSWRARVWVDPPPTCTAFTTQHASRQACCAFAYPKLPCYRPRHEPDETSQFPAATLVNNAQLAASYPPPPPGQHTRPQPPDHSRSLHFTSRLRLFWQHTTFLCTPRLSRSVVIPTVAAPVSHPLLSAIAWSHLCKLDAPYKPAAQSTITLATMLRRAPTTITLTQADIEQYEANRKRKLEQQQQEQQEQVASAQSSNTTDKTMVEQAPLKSKKDRIMGSGRGN